MRSREKLYERRLRRPIDETTRKAIHSAYLKRRHEFPVATEIHWHKDKRGFTLSSRWMSFNFGYTPENLVVEAELSFAAKMFTTDEHRKQAVQFLDELAEELGL